MYSVLLHNSLWQRVEPGTKILVSILFHLQFCSCAPEIKASVYPTQMPNPSYLSHADNQKKKHHLQHGDRHELLIVASAENPRDGPEDVPPEAFRGNPAVGPGDSLLQVAPREQQVRMRSCPSKLRLQSSHAQNVDVAMQRRCNLSLAVCS